MTITPHCSRRSFLRAGSAAIPLLAYGGGLSLVPRSANASRTDRFDRSVFLLDADLVKQMAMNAVDAARSAGAAYADVRITRTVSHQITTRRLGRAGFAWPEMYDDEEWAIGVRALVNGTWGSAASTMWTVDEPAILARRAVATASETARYRPGRVELAPTPVVSGHWQTPVEIDPFAVSLEERIDWAQWASTWGDVARGRYKGPDSRDWNPFWADVGAVVGDLRRCERAIATSDGSYVTQTLYEIAGGAAVNIGLRARGAVLPKGLGVLVGANGIPRTRAAAGWEFLRDAFAEDNVDALLDTSAQLQRLPTKPVEIGRYDVVCDAATMCSFVDVTLAQATELDRAMGREANRSGTSWLGPHPLDLLGSFSVGAPLLNIRANRSMARGLATVKWDDEAVAPTDAMLVENGILMDYQTTRENAGAIAPHYEKRGIPVRSNGCAGSETALGVTMSRASNIELVPGKTTNTFEDLVAGMSRGLALVNMGAGPDFQQRMATGGGLNDSARILEIVNGKPTAIITGASYLFMASEIWKNLTALGGPSSAMIMAGDQIKGEPDQFTRFSVQAVPGAFKNFPIFDASRI